MRFWVLGFQSFATYTNFKVLGLQGLAIAKILGSWVSRVSLHITILRSWVSRILRRITILMSWVSRVPQQKGSARSKIPQGPRPGTQRTLDLGSFWDLGTCLLFTNVSTLQYVVTHYQRTDTSAAQGIGVNGSASPATAADRPTRWQLPGQQWQWRSSQRTGRSRLTAADRPRPLTAV